MSVDTNRTCVRSKYFENKTAMDESLSDFQETKHNCKGPKTTQKVIKNQKKKVTKRIKGQKDIRTALKGKKNELLSYSKEFENVCKKSGIDVDAEQLQLAIALSKSIQVEVSDDASTSKSQSTQGRIAKIRTTLQEYGFKVPDAKSTPIKRTKKFRKQYKLLNITEEERYQKIKNKYSQILFETLDYKLNAVSSHQHYTPIYSLATNTEYEFMKNNNIFYIDSLACIERSTTIGSMLRNWGEIPGRPTSPVLFDKRAMDFSEILCSQEELDVILSGPIKSAQKIIETKTEKEKDLHYDMPKVALDSDEINGVIEVCDRKFDHVCLTKNTVLGPPAAEITKSEDVLNMDCNSTLSVQEQYRSCSPDIFDDEESCIMETSKPVLSQGHKTNIFTEEGMDLTECANNMNMEKTEFSSIDTTKTNIDDMEITECAVTASQGIKESVKEIDLTQSSDGNSIKDNDYDIDSDAKVSKSLNYNLSEIDIDKDSEKDADLSHKVFEDDNKPINCNTPIECIDLINISTCNHEIIPISKLNRAPNTDIDLTQSSNENENNLASTQVDEEISNDKIESMDLTQLSNSSTDISLPEINFGTTKKCQVNPDDTIILNEEEYLNTNKIKKVVTKDDEVFDLTEAGEECVDPVRNFTEQKALNLDNQSLYEDFLHEHSDSKENIESNELCNDSNSLHNTSKESNEIDLTQTSDGSTEINVSPRPIDSMPNNSSLGKRDDISVDYDEICEYVHEDRTDTNCFNREKDSSNSKYVSSKSEIYNDIEIGDSNNDLISNCSQNSEVFDLTDKECDYSLHKSRLDILESNNCDFGGISDKDNSDSHGGLKESLSNSVIDKDYTLEEVFLPQINLKNAEKSVETEDKTCASGSAEKVDVMNQNYSKTVAVVTPNNSRYTVKTTDVTPMLDYTSLTTPQRNKELDKYGLKPLKRKRAIQILTHIYNQTHPVVETYLGDDLQSPSKKRKQDQSLPSKTSPQTLQSPRKPDRVDTNKKSPSKHGTIFYSKSPRKGSANIKVSSPRKELDSSEENRNIYEVTSCGPNIRNVDCDPDDWVFQKREKAKVHTCRVPLHIAFYNYVSSRRCLREAILRYEPVNIDVIHKDLVSYGHRYDPKDLLRFLDKKCITVKTADNNAKSKR